MNDLRGKVDALAVQFVNSIREAVQESLLQDLSGALMNGLATRRPLPVAVAAGADKPVRAAKAGKGGRLARRSPEDIEKVAEDIIALVTSKGPMRAETIREALGIHKKEWMRPLGVALATKRLKKSGEKRATEYSAGASSAAPKKSKPAKKLVKKAAPKKKAVKAVKTKAKKKAAPKKAVKAKAKSKSKAAAKPPVESEPSIGDGGEDEEVSE